MFGPITSLSSLSRADGSASYKCPTTGYDLLGSVNAPIELPARRDALKPEEATVEVFVKPGNTTAGVGERYVEGILRSVLTKVVLGRERGFPRRGVVITLAIVGGETVTRGDSVSFPISAILFFTFMQEFDFVTVSYHFARSPSYLAPCSALGRRPSLYDLFCDSTRC